MTYAPIIGSCLLPTSKVSRGDAERSGEEKLTPWMGGVTEERMFDTSFGSPTSKNLAGDGRSRAAACALWLWDNLRELRKCKNLIYSCMEEKVVRETKQECQELGSLVSTKHFFFDCVIRLSSTEQPDLVKVLWIGFVAVRNLSERFRWNGQKWNWPQVSLWLQSNTSVAPFSSPRSNMQKASLTRPRNSDVSASFCSSLRLLFPKDVFALHFHLRTKRGGKVTPGDRIPRVYVSKCYC